MNFLKVSLLVLSTVTAFSFPAWSQSQEMGSLFNLGDNNPRAWGVVEKDKVYRSGQPQIGQFAAVQKKYGLRSVLILHGSMPEPIKQEIQEAEAAGVVYLHLPISDQAPLSDEHLGKIVSFLKNAPKPMLIHCRAGADRTGLISAIYQNLFMGVSLEQAHSDMLTIRYGHLSFGKTAAMDIYLRTVFPAKIEGLQKMMAAE